MRCTWCRSCACCTPCLSHCGVRWVGGSQGPVHWLFYQFGTTYCTLSCPGSDGHEQLGPLASCNPPLSRSLPLTSTPLAGTLPALMWQLEGALLADHLLAQLLPADLPAKQ